MASVSPYAADQLSGFGEDASAREGPWVISSGGWPSILEKAQCHSCTLMDGCGLRKTHLDVRFGSRNALRSPVLFSEANE
jgi:hypothetical protein